VDGSHLLPQFIEWMQKLDKSRDETFVEVFPEWKPVFEHVAVGGAWTQRYVFDRSRPLVSAATIILDKVGLGRT
jgi:hypothetical protein